MEDLNQFFRARSGGVRRGVSTLCPQGQKRWISQPRCRQTQLFPSHPQTVPSPASHPSTTAPCSPLPQLQIQRGQVSRSPIFRVWSRVNCLLKATGSPSISLRLCKVGQRSTVNSIEARAIREAAGGGFGISVIKGQIQTPLLPAEAMGT